jgi:hypothetical protein
MLTLRPICVPGAIVSVCGVLTVIRPCCAGALIGIVVTATIRHSSSCAASLVVVAGALIGIVVTATIRHSSSCAASLVVVAGALIGIVVNTNVIYSALVLVLISIPFFAMVVAAFF